LPTSAPSASSRTSRRSKARPHHLDWYTVGKQLAPPQQHKEPAEDKRFAVINRPRFMDRRQWTAAARRLPCLASIV